MAANPPVDLAHLARYTGGDAGLNAEVLRLFCGQSEQLIGRLKTTVEAGDARSWREITHSLKGAARGIGAFELADFAAAIEPLDPMSDRDGAHAALHELSNRAQMVQWFIDEYLAGQSRVHA